MSVNHHTGEADRRRSRPNLPLPSFRLVFNTAWCAAVGWLALVAIGVPGV